MSQEPNQNIDDSLRRNIIFEDHQISQEGGTAMRLINKLRIENEVLQQEKDELELELHDRIITLESQQYIEKDKNDQDIILTRHEIKELNDNSQIEEKNKKEDNEKIKIKITENENKKLIWENQKLKMQIERLKQDLDSELSLASEFEIKYLASEEENLKIKKNYKEKIQNQQKITEEETMKKQEAVILMREEQKKKERAIVRAEIAEKRVAELEIQFYNLLNNEKNDHIEQNKDENQSQNEQEKDNEKEEEKENGIVKNEMQEENYQLIQEIEIMKIENNLIKQKLQEQNIEKEIHTNQITEIHSNQIVKQEKDDEISIPSDEIEKERAEKEKILEQLRNKQQEENKEQLQPIDIKDNNCCNEQKQQQDVKGNDSNNILNISQSNNNQSIIAIHNPSTYDISFVDIDGTKKMIYKHHYGHNTVSLTQVLSDGIWILEAEFSDVQRGHTSIGIVRDNFTIPTGAYVNGRQNSMHMAVYGQGGWNQDCTILCKGRKCYGNQMFQEKDIIKLEFDSEKGTLKFFLNNTQQPVYIQGIKEKVYMLYCNSSCTIHSLKKIQSPTSKSLSNEFAIHW